MTHKINDRFKQLRKRINVTQEQMASFLSLEQSSISKFENGERTLTIHNLEKASALFGISFQNLVSEEEHDAIISPSFRRTNVSSESLKDISEINKLALNIIEMNDILGKNNG